MNKNLHRIIFNAARGQRMVVAETAASLGKGRNAAAHAVVTALAFASVFLLTPASAQIKADPSAPANQRPVILAAPNGVPVINIQTPSAAGISRNTYSQMDVARPGAILNNSRTNVQSQLGGFIQGNPYLATGSAKAILNEVNSANPTLLKGPVEVAGQKADVIIANPAGIKVDGSTFINAANVVLTTGTPQLSSQGSLESYRVQRGTIVIEGLGLDTRTASYTDILARAIEVNAGLWADYLRVSGGAAEVNAADPSAASGKPLEGMGAKPKFMLDVAAIGGMYARHIYLVGSESGLGVSNHGIIGAAEAGNVVVLADGTLTNRGSIQAAGTVQVNAAGGIANEGVKASIASQRDISLSAGAGGISNTDGATVAAVGVLRMDGPGPLQNTQGTLAANGAVAITGASQINNDKGYIGAAGDLSLNAGAITNTAGTLVAGGAASVSAASLTGDGHVLSHGDITLNLSGHYTHSGEITALGNASLSVAGDLTNNALLQAGKTLSISAGNLANAAAGEITSGAATAVNVTGTLTNRGLIDGISTQVNAGTVTNTGTGRLYGNHLSIQAGSVINEAETLAGITSAPVIAARERLDIGAASITNQGHALIFSAGDLSLGGALDSARRATGSAVSINNASATLESLGDMSLSASQVSNTNSYFAMAPGAPQTEARHEFMYDPGVGHVDAGQVFLYQQRDHSGNYFNATLLSTYARADGPDIYVNMGNCWCEMGGGFTAEWSEYQFQRTTITDSVTASDPGKILAAGKLGVTGNLVNDKSQVIAGGTLTVTGGTLANIDAFGRRTQIDTGQTRTHTYVRGNHHGIDHWYDWAPYTPAPVATTVSIPVSVFRANTAPAGSGSVIGAIAPITAALPGGAGAIRTIAPNAFGASGLFRVAPDPQASYLIETDPRFTSHSAWLSSDYMLDALGIKPGETAKRLGDGFYEQRLVREQVAQLTGQRFLGDYTSDDAQYRALMEAGTTFAKEWNIRPGIALSAAQMAQLTSDIVWLVEQEAALPDGRTARALVPQVYARVREGDLDGSGTLLAGRRLDIDLKGDLMNSGTLAGRQLVQLSAQNVHNLAGRIDGDAVTVRAREDINIIGGQVIAKSSLDAAAGRDLKVETTTQAGVRASGNASYSSQGIDRVAGLYVTGDKGLLVASAGRDARFTAAQVLNAGRDGSTVIQAGRNVELGTIKAASSESVTWNSRNYRSDSFSQEVGTQVQAAGAVKITAGQDVNARAASVQAGGALEVNASRDVNITAGEQTHSHTVASQSTQRGFLSRKTTTTYSHAEQATAQGASLGGETVSVTAGRDISITGSTLVGDTGASLTATNNITVQEATNTREDTRLMTHRQSGLFGSGGGITLGKREQSTDTNTTTTAAAGSTVGAITGNVTIKAGGTYTQTGSDVIAPGGDVDIKGKDTKITEARETSTASTEQQFRQSGITVGIASPLITAAQTVGQMASAAGHTDDARMKALAIAAGALALKNNAADISKAAKALAEGDLKGAGSLSVSIGSSKSQSNTTSTSDTARESTVKAGGNVTIRATGAGTGEGETSNVLIRGSTVQAGNTLTLVADNQVLLQAARNEATRKSSEKSSSASIGVSIGASGFGITASGSTSRGHADGQDVYFSNTQVQGNTVVLKSGGDTDISGAVVRGNTVKADIGGNLTIQSKQDTSTYKEQSNSAGGSLTIGAGLGGSVSAGRTEIDSTYASVKEQSGIRAGDGGFQVEVKGRTNLIGGAITSTSQAVEEGRNQFESKEGVSLSDVHNTASYEASSGGFTIGVGGNLKNSGAGAGSKSASASSTTEAAISGIAGNQEARTGDAQTGITPIFNRDAVERDVKAQATIFTEFGRQAIPAAAGFADKKAVELRREGKEQEAATWDEGGSNRTALYGALGFLSGGISGAAGAVASAALVPTLGEEIAALNLPEPVRQGVTQLMGMAVGAAAGGAAGAATALPQTAFNYVSHSPFANVKLVVSRENARLLNECGSNCTLADLRRMDLQLQKLEAAANLATVAERSTMTAQQAAQFQQLALELVPFYGNAESVRQLVTGRTTVTDEEASRFWAAVGVVPVVGGMLQRVGRTTADVIQALVAADKAAGLATQLGLINDANRLFKQYIDDIETQTGYRLGVAQRAELATEMRAGNHAVKLTPVESKALRSEFDGQRTRLISEWETRAGQSWPKVETIAADGTIVLRPADAHHVIPVTNDGPTQWWNITPAFSKNHRLVHAPGSPLKQLQSRIE